MLREGRTQRRWTLEEASSRAGISSSTWSRLEIAADGRTTFATISRAASAIGQPLRAYLDKATATNMPRDIVHLRHQELVIRTSQIGAWRSLPEELIDRDARSSRAADVLLRRTREYALAEVWDWFDDVGAAARDWHRRLEAVERYAIARMVGDESLPRVSGVWIVRATRRNRGLVHEHRHFFKAMLPGSGTAWLAALTDRDVPMPKEAALLWVTVKGDRLYPARLG
ncbi:hypothetical protein BH23CHL7_BH23CHL7_21800 [soil metagenome]